MNSNKGQDKKVWDYYRLALVDSDGKVRII